MLKQGLYEQVVNKETKDQVDYLTKILFASSNDRRFEDISGQQNFFYEAEVEQDLSVLEEETVIREYTRKKKATHEDLIKGLKVEKAFWLWLDHRPTKEMTDDQLAELTPWSEKLQSIKNRM